LYKDKEKSSAKKLFKARDLKAQKFN